MKVFILLLAIAVGSYGQQGVDWGSVSILTEEINSSLDQTITSIVATAMQENYVVGEPFGTRMISARTTGQKILGNVRNEIGAQSLNQAKSTNYLDQLANWFSGVRDDIQQTASQMSSSTRNDMLGEVSSLDAHITMLRNQILALFPY